MIKQFKFLFYFGFLITIFSCARKGNPDGGPKDEDAPLMVTANPPYKSVSFNEKEIKIYFDEYINLKELNKNLVVSPPFKNPALITPQGSPSKYINIKIIDTLKPNTTYTLNFGKAVQDNNESNVLENFKYVFSTGTYIDSLTLKGSIKDAIKRKPDIDISVLLYRIDSAYSDSLIYKQKPNYVTNTIDTTKFEFTNLQKGKYLLLALKDATNDYIFNPKTDKIGFYKDTIELPKDSLVLSAISLFKEKQPYIFKRGKEASKGKIIFGFNGDGKEMKITSISSFPEKSKVISKFEKDKDTLNYWYTPFETDSLNFVITNGKQIDTTTIMLRKKKIDSLKINSNIRGVLNPRDTFFLETNNPIINIDTTKITLIDKDTLSVKYQFLKSKKENKIAFLFDRKHSNGYSMEFLPGALSDIFSVENDTLKYSFNTKKIEDYGTIKLNVINSKKSNLIIELLTEKNELIERKFLSSSELINFNFLLPKKYVVRAIIDSDNNKRWDSGIFLNKIQPEEIFYFSTILNVRANWENIENFTIN
ncbi:Ig-like domain-containing protein [Lutibacter sp. Hel_I_33_5]|uniref:Ig-like domain-containing protein n=1 Tax=Lutibacter sp. Hel_I_33_5 TaxID=1566289 RepID=UPI00210734FB|nr:Ig-like domain-containing protein [Lutibacter sp. Hel_I_33_5]